MNLHRSNPIEIGGTTIRFYTSFQDATTVAWNHSRSFGGEHRAAHVMPFGWLIEDVRGGTFSDREGRIPEVIMRLLAQRMKTSA